MKIFLKIGVVILSCCLFSFNQDVFCQDESSNHLLSIESTQLVNQPIEAFQQDLLHFAFETATLIPLNPHIKDRSRAQMAVVNAALKLNQPKEVLEFIPQIVNWRQSEAYADLAFYCAQKGMTDSVQQFLDLAKKIAEDSQDWRRDRVYVKIAQTNILLGRRQEAQRLEHNVVESEQGKVAQTKAMVSFKDYFEDQLKELEALITQGQFDVIKNALAAYVELFNRFYSNVNRREKVETTIKASWDKMPIFIRVELLLDLARHALAHQDNKKALSLVNESKKMVDAYQWPLEYQIEIVSKISSLRFFAGEKDQARKEADQMLSLFETQGQSIVNIYRAGALRPLAEVFQSMGDSPKALSVYQKTLAAGVENPNSRPRAEDLAATALSMALGGFKPDEKLWAQMKESKQSLKAPW